MNFAHDNPPTAPQSHTQYTNVSCATMWTLGSLKDVLENEAIQLDWNFRMSLIHDIVKVIRKLLD